MIAPICCHTAMEWKGQDGDADALMWVWICACGNIERTAVS